MSQLNIFFLSCTLALLPLTARALEGERRSYPAKTHETGHLVIHAATDVEAMEPLLLDFQAVYPDISIDFVDYVTNDLFRETFASCKTGEPAADIILSSSVDQLVRLANDGCAQSHSSPETQGVPSWANWRNEVFGFTFEPIVFVYDKRSVPPADVPRSHDALLDLLRNKAETYRGRIGTYDIHASGIGYLLAFYDARQAPTANGRLLETLSRSNTTIRCCNGEVLGELAAGRISLAYNVLGSYAYAAARNNANLGIVIPRDYALILSRGALLPATSRSPNLGKRFLNYLLSSRGKQVARDSSFFFAENAPLPAGVDGPDKLMASGIGRPIRIGPALLAAQDEIQRQTFILDWRRHIGER